MEWELRFSEEKPRIAIIVSRLHHSLMDVLHRHSIGELQGVFMAIISNHAKLKSAVERHDILFHFFPITPENKQVQEEKELELLDSLEVDLVILARYTPVLSKVFVSCYPNRIINIPHTFLPAFAGTGPCAQAHARGVKLIGATIQYVAPVVDEGPIIEQDVVRVSHRDTVEDLVRKGGDIERIVFARAVRHRLERPVLPCANRTVVFN